MMEYDVFISCKSEDYDLAESIYEFLKKNGIRAFLASKELRKLGDSEFRKAIVEAIEGSYHLIVFASKAEYVYSKWVYYEWDMFLHAKLNGLKQGQLMTILHNITVKDLKLDLCQYESFSLDNYQEKILYYVETPASRIRNNNLSVDNGENGYPVPFRTIETKEEIDKLVHEFIATNGEIQLDETDCEALYSKKSVSYAIMPIGRGENRIRDAISNLKLSIKGYSTSYSLCLFNIRLASADKAIDIDEIGELNMLVASFSEDIEIRWGASLKGVRSEIFIILC